MRQTPTHGERTAIDANPERKRRIIGNMDRRGEQDRDPFRLRAQGFRRRVFYARLSPDEFGTVHGC